RAERAASWPPRGDRASQSSRERTAGSPATSSGHCTGPATASPDPWTARGFCRSLRSDAGEKLLARGLRGRPRLVVFHLSLALPALIVGPTEPLAAHGSMRRCCSEGSRTRAARRACLR